MAFWKQLLLCMKSMKMERSTADPCLYFKWTDLGLVVLISWIDDNLIVGSEEAVTQVKKDLMDRFDCEDCGDLDEYVGCKITRLGNDALKFTQPVLLQSYNDEFDLPSGKYSTPAVAGSVLTKCEEADALNAEEQTKYRSGVGKLMHAMQYSRPETYQGVRDLARHMSQASEKHVMAMLRVMKYCVDRPNRGLILRPDTKWDGSRDFQFTISGMSDSDYAKCPNTRRSVTGSRVVLNGMPVMFKSATQKHVALSVTEQNCMRQSHVHKTCCMRCIY